MDGPRCILLVQNVRDGCLENVSIHSLTFSVKLIGTVVDNAEKQYTAWFAWSRV